MNQLRPSPQPLYAETEDFLRNTRDYLSSGDASIIEHHSSLKKRLCKDSNQILSNQTIKSALSYDTLNSQEKDFCEKLNLLPTDYLNLKVKIVREQGKVTPINEKLI
jgi:hypothetical protein